MLFHSIDLFSLGDSTFTATPFHTTTAMRLDSTKDLRRAQDNGVATIVDQPSHTPGVTRQTRSAARSKSTMEMEMHEWQSLDTAPRQLAVTSRQRTNASGHSRRHREGMSHQRAKLRRLLEFENLIEHLLVVAIALCNAPYRQHDPDCPPEAWDKDFDQKYIWADGEDSASMLFLRAARNVARHYHLKGRLAASLFFSTDGESEHACLYHSSTARQIADNKALGIQQYLSAALWENNRNAAESSRPRWYDQAQPLSMRREQIWSVTCFVVLDGLDEGLDEGEGSRLINDLLQILSKIREIRHVSNSRVRILVTSRPELRDFLDRLDFNDYPHQSITPMGLLATEAHAVSSALEAKLQGSRSRHKTSRRLSHNAVSPCAPAGHISMHESGITFASHGHQTFLLEELSPASTVWLPSSQGLTFANVLQRIRPCHLLVTLGFLVIGGSLAVGLYYSIAKDRMGDGFTAAGWMTAVGTLILAAPMAKHYPHCRCWDWIHYPASR
jgi:hypothetical protein